MTTLQTIRVVLASASETRAELLRKAGVVFHTDPSDVDEEKTKTQLRKNGAGPKDVAQILADIKAKNRAAGWPGALIVGADQVLSQGDEIFNKPDTLDTAKEQLMRLSGKQHELHTAATVVQNGEVVWQKLSSAELLVRRVSKNFVESYLEKIGLQATKTVGSYMVEGLGIQLFEDIRGDYFSVLGLPLLPLLEFFRKRGVLEK